MKADPIRHSDSHLSCQLLVAAVMKGGTLHICCRRHICSNVCVCGNKTIEIIIPQKWPIITKDWCSGIVLVDRSIDARVDRSVLACDGATCPTWHHITHNQSIQTLRSLLRLSYMNNLRFSSVNRRPFSFHFLCFQPITKRIQNVENPVHSNRLVWRE